MRATRERARPNSTQSGACCSSLAPIAAVRLCVAASARLLSRRRPARSALAAVAAAADMVPPPPPPRIHPPHASAGDGARSPSWHSCDSSPSQQGDAQRWPGQLTASPSRSPAPSPTTTVAASDADAAATPASPASLAGSPQQPSPLARPADQSPADPTPHLRVGGGLRDAYTPWLRSGGGGALLRRSGSGGGGGGGGRQRASSWLTSPAPMHSMTRFFQIEDEEVEGAGVGDGGGSGGGKRRSSSSKGKSSGSGSGGVKGASRATASASPRWSPAPAGMVALASTEELEEEEEGQVGEADDEEEEEAFGGGGRWQTPAAGAGRRRSCGRQVVLSEDDDDDDDADEDDDAARSTKGAGPSASPACWDSDGEEEEDSSDGENGSGNGSDGKSGSGTSSGSGTTAADTDSTFDVASGSASSGSSGSSSPFSGEEEEEEEEQVGDDGNDDDETGVPDSTPAGKQKKRPTEKKQKEGLPTPAAAAAAADTVPGGLAFARRRERLARDLYAEWNEAVFAGRLPADLAIVWNPRLRCTAGQVVDDRSLDAQKVDPRSRTERVACRLELSPRVIDRERRLRDTLAHEMAHVAAWHLDRDFERAHGPTFQRWSRAFEARVADVRITTRHSYAPSVPQQRWACQDKEGCGRVYSRSKMTICVRRHVCAACRGKLVYLGRFSPGGDLLVAGPGTADASAVKPKRPLNAFGAFVQQNYGAVKQSTRNGTHAAVMAELSARWGALKLEGGGGGGGQ